MGRVLADAARQLPVVSLTGPRQSGKTTLARATFPHYAYISLENPDTREAAKADPRGFLRQFSQGVILDEAQRAPELFSYIQGIVDDTPRAGQFVLTGSHNFLLMRSISQSLAGRCAILHLLPLSLAELSGREPADPQNLPDFANRTPYGVRNLMATLHKGFYPRLHDQPIDTQPWLADYTEGYLDRDVRLLENIGDLDAFALFVRMCAARSGQLLNLSSLASDCGITHPTARRWLSILQASFLVTTLRPYFRNYHKRLIKSPKLYFLDTGLLCYLLRIRTPEDLPAHPLRGAIFETLVVAELLKSHLNRRLEPDLYFWRDSAGHEVDVLLDSGTRQIPIEVKSGLTLPSDFAKGLDYWLQLAGQPGPAAVVHGGDDSFIRHNIACLSWRVL